MRKKGRGRGGVGRWFGLLVFDLGAGYKQEAKKFRKKLT